jgi:hypothetical protein
MTYGDHEAAILADMERCRTAGICWMCSTKMTACFTSGVVPEWWKDVCCPDCLPEWAWPKEAFAE